MDYLTPPKTYKHKYETVRAVEDVSATAKENARWIVLFGDNVVKFMSDEQFKRSYEETDNEDIPFFLTREEKLTIACQEYHSLLKFDELSPPLLAYPDRCPFCKKLVD